MVSTCVTHDRDRIIKRTTKSTLKRSRGKAGKKKKKIPFHTRVHYLVNVKITAKDVKLSVKRLEETDDFHGRRCGANSRETNQVAEEHRDIVVALRLDRFA